MRNSFVQLVAKVLEYPLLYDFYQTLVGGVQARKKFARDAMKNSFEGILDLGCGTGQMAIDVIPDCPYIGIDLSNEYLRIASKSLIDLNINCKLFSSSINDFDFSTIASKLRYLVYCGGLLHHLSDNEVRSLLTHIRSNFPNSTLISIDPTYDSETSKVAKWFALNDRGEHVRDVDSALNLFDANFFDVTYSIRRDIFRIPLDTLCLEVNFKKTL